MMRNFVFFVVAGSLATVVAVSCSGSAPAKSPDASGGSGFGASCTMASDTSTECESGVCTDTIDMAPTPLCTQKCDPANLGSDCPVGSKGQKCNMKGYCRP